MVCLQSFCLNFLLLFLLSCFSSDMVCLQRFFVFVVHFFSKLYKFKLERIQHNINNINILSRTVLLALFFRFFLFMFCFCLVPGVGVGGALAFIKKTGVWGSILLTIYMYYFTTSCFSISSDFDFCLWMWCVVDCNLCCDFTCWLC